MKAYKIESILKCQYADALIKSKSNRVVALAKELYKESIEMGSHYGKARIDQLKKDDIIKMKELRDSAGARAYQADLDVYNSEKQL